MIDPARGEPFDPDRFPRRLNLGCGWDWRKDYLNVDLQPFHHPDLLCDVTRLDVLPSAYYEHVLAQDVLEHVPRTRCQNTLREWNRVLVPGGTLELQVPNVLGLADLLREAEHQTVERQMSLLKCLYGTQGYEGDFHFNGFTEVTLRHMLAVAGFDRVELATRHGWLFEATASKARHVEREPILELPNNHEFLEMVYRTRLGRPADAAGLAFWHARLQQGDDRERVLAELTAASATQAGDAPVEPQADPGAQGRA